MSETVDELVRAFAADARRVRRVLRADVVTELARADTVNDVIARRWLHSLPPELPVGVVVTLEPHVYWGSGTTASHGTPHDYDARVPVLFYGPWFNAGRFDTPAAVVDMAPTIAAVLGVKPLDNSGPVLARAGIREVERQLVQPQVDERWRLSGLQQPA